MLSRQGNCSHKNGEVFDHDIVFLSSLEGSIIYMYILTAINGLLWRQGTIELIPKEKYFRIQYLGILTHQ